MKTHETTVPLVFVCSPYGDLHSNYKNAVELCSVVYEYGAQPIAPHIHYTQFMNESEGRETGLLFSLNILRKCDALFYDRDIDPSSYMIKELMLAWEEKIPVLTDLVELEGFCLRFGVDQ